MNKKVIIILLFSFVLSGCTSTEATVEEAYDEAYFSAANCLNGKLEEIQSDIDDVISTLDYASSEEYEYMENAIYDAINALEDISFETDCL